MSSAPLPASAQFLRGLFLLLMLSTGVAKLLDMPGFYGIVASYQTLPLLLVAPAAWVLTLTEVMLAAWLLSGRALQNAALLLVLMHLMYLAWLLMALARGLDLPNCGCFGVYLARPLTVLSPVEDLCLLALASAFWAQARRVRR